MAVLVQGEQRAAWMIAKFRGEASDIGVGSDGRKDDGGKCIEGARAVINIRV